MSTRTVTLWLANDEGLYHEAVSLGRSQAGPREYREMVEEAVGFDDMTGLTSDLMSCALQDVDWQSIADDYYEEDEEEEEKDDEDDEDDEEDDGSYVVHKSYEEEEEEEDDED